MNDLMIKAEYFDWLCRFIDVDILAEYKSLLEQLFQTDFNYIMERDANRFEDGVELRYKFGYENNIPDAAIASLLDYTPCSIFEMMVALAMKCENIADDPDIGDRTPQWFWGMLESMGLLLYSDDRYNEFKVSMILTQFLNRNYERNGRGGLFTMDDPPEDMRYVEIWFQAMWYLNSKIKGGY